MHSTSYVSAPGLLLAQVAFKDFQELDAKSPSALISHPTLTNCLLQPNELLCYPESTMLVSDLQHLSPHLPTLHFTTANSILGTSPSRKGRNGADTPFLGQFLLSSKTVTEEKLSQTFWCSGSKYYGILRTSTSQEASRRIPEGQVIVFIMPYRFLPLRPQASRNQKFILFHLLPFLKYNEIHCTSQ